MQQKCSHQKIGYLHFKIDDIKSYCLACGMGSPELEQQATGRPIRTAQGSVVLIEMASEGLRRSSPP